MKLGRTAKVLLAVAAFVGTYRIIFQIYVATTEPGSAGQTLEGFLSTKPSPLSIEKIESGNLHYVFVMGRMPPLHWITVPSGPPCYVFDSKGNLIAWTHDLGDGDPFRKKWPFSLKREKISADEALRIIRARELGIMDRCSDGSRGLQPTGRFSGSPRRVATADGTANVFTRRSAPPSFTIGYCGLQPTATVAWSLRDISLCRS